MKKLYIHFISISYYHVVFLFQKGVCLSTGHPQTQIVPFKYRELTVKEISRCPHIRRLFKEEGEMLG